MSSFWGRLLRQEAIWQVLHERDFPEAEAPELGTGDWRQRYRRSLALRTLNVRPRVLLSGV